MKTGKFNLVQQVLDTIAADASERRNRNAFPRIGQKHCRISRAEQPPVGATAAITGETGTVTAGADGAPAAGAGGDDDGGDGDADPDGRRRRNFSRHKPAPSPAHPLPAHPKPERLLRLPELMTRCGLSRSTIYQYIKDGKFPASISIGARAVAWLESDIDRWIAEQIKGACV